VQLAAAAERARRIGVEAHRVLIMQGRLSEAQYLDCLAQETGASRADMTFRLATEESIEAVLADRLARVRLPSGGTAFMITPRAATIGWLLRLKALVGVHLILATEAEFIDRLFAERADALMERALTGRLADAGVRSARLGASRLQRIGFGGALSGLALAAVLAPYPTLFGVMGLLSLVMLIDALRKGAALLAHRRPVPAAAALPDSALPRYTVLIALKDEARVLPRLLEAMAQLDYPVEKLEIVLALEQDDTSTRLEKARFALPPHMRTVIVPRGAIQTKPRALNMALLFATGELVTIFDAEDIPQPDQLRKAAARFGAEPELVCLQASLVPDNAYDGVLEAFFALEYAALFDVLQNGLCSLDLPLPLGGTSNHLRRDTLVRAGGWDAYNVTEDAELGLRLWSAGHKLGKLVSATEEEAPPTLQQWFNQRRRWCKGWMQTLVAHAVTFPADCRRHGFLRPALNIACLAATVASLLLFPIGPLAIGLSYGVYPHSAATGITTLVEIVMFGGFAFGVSMLFLPALVGLMRRRLWLLLALLPLLPLYQLLIGAAAWAAISDLWHRPYHWFKTEHGLARTSRSRAQRLPASLA